MDPISKLAQSLALLRRQQAAKGAPAPAGGDKAAAQARPARSSRAPASRGDLRERVIAGLAALAETDQASRERQVAVFVEQVLLYEWGPGFRESAQFRQTVKRIARAMDSEPQVRVELEVLLRELVAESRR